VKPIAEVMAIWIIIFGPPKIVQCDNKRKFKEALLILLHYHGIKIINSNPRSLQTQGLVKQGNGIVEQKIRVWKAENRLSC
jgi:hypothetical protein